MLRALFYRRPQTIEPIRDRSTTAPIHLVRVKRHQQARRYTLRVLAATREVLLTIPTRGSVKEAKAFRGKEQRLDCRAAASPAEGRAVQRW